MILSHRSQLAALLPHRPHREHGYVVALVCLMLIVILIMASLSVDVGLWYNRSSKAQRAADSAALASVAELVKQKKAGASNAAAKDAARAVALQVAKDNGFDDALGGIAVTLVFSTGAGGADHVVVTVQQNNPGVFFSGMFGSQVVIARHAEATMSSCQATCNQTVGLKNSYATMIDTSVGGDGWQPVIAGDYIFNLYHHDNGKILYCVDKLSGAVCAPAGRYPVEPYTGMRTNYTPKMASDGNKVYFVVQTATSTGLGCWDGDTGTACSGFGTPKQLAAYAANGSNNAGTRIDGPEKIGTELWMYGDDNRMYCYDLASQAMCSGYPRNFPTMNGSHDMPLAGRNGVAGGVSGDGGIQFDMLVHPDGRIFTTLGPTSDGYIWMSCWDTTRDNTCSGWTNARINAGRPLLFFMYDSSGSPNAVCARAAKRGGGNGSGHQCVDLSGAAVANRVTFTFDGNSGQQEATAVTSVGHTVTYFPFTGGNDTRCWDWTTGSECAIQPSNWSNTKDYAYLYDGSACILGLGHSGDLWSFNVDDGQYPCRGAPSGARARFTPCGCADGVSTRWTALSVNQNTNLSDFEQFLVTIKLPDGTVWKTVDLVQSGLLTVDLSLLNSMSPPPAYIDVVVETKVLPGHEDNVFVGTNSDGIGTQSGVVPTLVG